MRPATTQPQTSGKNDEGEFERFDNLMHKLVSVSPAKIKAQMAAEKIAKTSSSRVPAVS